MSGRGSTGPTREECSSHSRRAARFFCRQQFEQRRLSSYPLNHPADQVSNLSGCKCKLLSAQASQLPYLSTKHIASPSQSVVRRGPGWRYNKCIGNISSWIQLARSIWWCIAVMIIFPVLQWQGQNSFFDAPPRSSQQLRDLFVGLMEYPYIIRAFLASPNQGHSNADR